MTKLGDRLRAARDSQTSVNDDVDQILEDQAFAEVVAEYGKDAVKAVLLIVLKSLAAEIGGQG